MLNFFRSIRKKLFSESKFSKYILYAIGEIILIVLGILIALKINNWNQHTIDAKKEIFHLENIVNNLEDDLNYQISPCITKTGEQIKAFELLEARFFKLDDISNDSVRQLLFKFLGQWDLVLSTAAFENLVSTGMDLLTNDSLKSKILSLYANHYVYVKNLQDYYDKIHYDRITTILLDHVDLWDQLSDGDKLFIKNEKRLYTAIRTEGHYTLPNYLNELIEIKEKSEELIRNIKAELKRLK